MRDAYAYPADFYDRLQDEEIYENWIKLLQTVKARHGIGKIKTVLDLGCGTGRLTEHLCFRCYDVTALDKSPEMLSRAVERVRKFTARPVLTLQGDMRTFELNDVVDMTVCALDCLNYLPTRADLVKAFKRVALFMRGDGLFVFDMNTPYKFKNFYAGHDFVLENREIVCTWQNELAKSGKYCDFYLSFFKEIPSGNYYRVDETQREYIYSAKTVARALEEAGFCRYYIYGTNEFTDLTDYTDTSPRMFCVALRDKRQGDKQ